MKVLIVIKTFLLLLAASCLLVVSGLLFYGAFFGEVSIEDFILAIMMALIFPFMSWIIFRIALDDLLDSGGTK